MPKMPLSEEQNKAHTKQNSDQMICDQNECALLIIEFGLSSLRSNIKPKNIQ